MIHVPWNGHSALFIASTVALATFANTLFCGFVWDDRAAILNNMDIRTDASDIRDLFEHDFWGSPLRSASSHKSFRPLTVLSFRLNYALGRFHPMGYHALNVLLHAITTVLVLLVGRRILAPYAFHRAPVFASLLFAVHPIHCDSVASIVGRADVLCTLFSLTAFLLYDSALRATVHRQQCALIVAALATVVIGTFLNVEIYDVLFS
jgi:hypothetical protein